MPYTKHQHHHFDEIDADGRWQHYLTIFPQLDGGHTAMHTSRLYDHHCSASLHLLGYAIIFPQLEGGHAPMQSSRLYYHHCSASLHLDVDDDLTTFPQLQGGHAAMPSSRLYHHYCSASLYLCLFSTSRWLTVICLSNMHDEMGVLWRFFY